MRTKATMGRPTSFTAEISEAICIQLAEGKSLRAICETDEMPSRETVRRWLRDDEDFRGQYARARLEQADHYADEIIEIADTSTDANLARVRIDARKWKASKLAPRVYGEKLDMTTGGEKIGIGAVILEERRKRAGIGQSGKPTKPE